MIDPYSELIFPVNDCNNNCIFCSTAKTNNLHFFVPFSKIKKSILKAKKKGKKSITLFGGEPTIHPNFLELAEFINRQNMGLIISTNSRLFFYKDFAHSFVRNSNIINIQTSIYGNTSKLHDSLTRVTGSFLQTVTGIKNLLAEGLSNERLVINTTILKQNLPFLEDILNFEIDNFDVKNIKFSFLELVGNALYAPRSITPRLFAVQRKLIDLSNSLKRLDGLKIYIEKGPLCCTPNSPLVEYIYEPDIQNKERFVFVPQCRLCKKKPVCTGIQKIYLDLYGYKELHPLSG